jgi:hypothetical protein
MPFFHGEIAIYDSESSKNSAKNIVWIRKKNEQNSQSDFSMLSSKEIKNF